MYSCTCRPFPKKGKLNNDFMTILLFKFLFWGMGGKYIYSRPFPNRLGFLNTMDKTIDEATELFRSQKIPVFEPGEEEYERSVATPNLLFRFSRPHLVI